MKKITLLSLAVAALLFTACEEKTKKAAAEATAAVNVAAEKAAEETKEKTAHAVEAAKEKVSEATEAVKQQASETTETVKKQASAATEAVKEAAEEASKAVQETTAKAVKATKEAVASVTGDTAAGEAAYAKCAGCHGKDGKTKALGKSEEIAGQSAADLETKLAEYKAGTRNVAGMGSLMKGQVASLSEDDIKAVSAYISGL
jgi:cytochrome c553